MNCRSLTQYSRAILFIYSDSRFQFIYYDDVFIEYCSTNAPLFIRYSPGRIRCRVITVRFYLNFECNETSFLHWPSAIYSRIVLLIHRTNAFIFRRHGSRKPPSISLHNVQHLDCCQKLWPSDTLHEMFELVEIDDGKQFRGRDFYSSLLSNHYKIDKIYFSNFCYRKERKSVNHGRAWNAIRCAARWSIWIEKGKTRLNFDRLHIVKTTKSFNKLNCIQINSNLINFVLLDYLEFMQNFLWIFE